MARLEQEEKGDGPIRAARHRGPRDAQRLPLAQARGDDRKTRIAQRQKLDVLCFCDQQYALETRISNSGVIERP